MAWDRPREGDESTSSHPAFPVGGGAASEGGGLERVGPYTHLEWIGGGGMGEVYRARDAALDREVAIKIAKSRSERAGALIGAEGRVLARLKHPNIAEVYAAGEFRDALGRGWYIAMEYLAGALPMTRERMPGSMTRRARARLMRDACAAVGYAHDHEVVHGDLKPGNLLAWRRDGEWSVKVMDFGLARVFGQEDRGQGGMGGTLGYMSPELLERGGRDPDRASDAYALGRTVERVLGLEDARERAILGRGIERAVARATAADPRARESAVVELESALSRWLESPVERARAWWSWLGWTRPIAAAIVLVLATATGAYVAGTPMLFEVSPRAIFAERVARAMPEVTSLENTLVVVATDEDWSRAAAAAGMDHDLAEGVGRSRRLSAALARALARAAPRVVAWDVFYMDPAGDEDGPMRAEREESSRVLASALRALRDAGAPSVLAIHVWDPSADATRRPNEAIYAAGSGIGPATVFAPPPAYAVPLLVKKPGAQGSASLALRAATLWRKGNTDVRFEFDAGEGGIEIERATRRLGLTEVERESIVLRDVSSGNDRPEVGISSRDVVGVMPMAWGADGAFARSTLRASEVLAMSPADLAERTRGKVVVVGDLTRGRDRLAEGEGGDRHGCFLQACAIDVLTRGTWIRSAGIVGRWSATLAAACLGVVGTLFGMFIARKVRGKGAVRASGVFRGVVGFGSGVLVACGAVLVCGTLAREMSYVCQPAVPALAGVLGALAGLVHPRVAGDEARAA